MTAEGPGAHEHHTHPELGRDWCCCGYAYKDGREPPTLTYAEWAGEASGTRVRVTGIALSEPTVWILEGIEVDTGRPAGGLKRLIRWPKEVETY